MFPTRSINMERCFVERYLLVYAIFALFDIIITEFISWEYYGVLIKIYSFQE